MKPRFFYFDMGNCLLFFSHERMAEQVGQVTGVSAEKIRQSLFVDGLHWAYERGEFAREAFYGRLCESVGARLPDIDTLDAAGNAIFELNTPMVALVGKLAAAGHRLGVFSNTTASHWDYCTRRFGALKSVFPVHALSFRLKAMKPDAAAYAQAAELAHVPPESIFFTDDREENVTAARAAGWDAELFTSVCALNEALRARGVLINY